MEFRYMIVVTLGLTRFMALKASYMGCSTSHHLPRGTVCVCGEGGTAPPRHRTTCQCVVCVWGELGGGTARRRSSIRRYGTVGFGLHTQTGDPPAISRAWLQ